ncbi:hypothetical protein [Polaribacter aquimarinus]|nr:hypothetical protein [Polaribacter aquimarinus]
MNKEHTTSLVASSNFSQRYSIKNQLFLHQFVNWFRDFIENAE